MRVREWLGSKSLTQLQTYYAFIERNFGEKNIEISFDQAIRLYKTFLEIIKSPFLDTMDLPIDEREELRPPQPRATNSLHHTAPLEATSKE